MILPAKQDRDIGPWEWVVAVLFAPLGCLIALLYFVQGKAKAVKMLVVSLIGTVIFAQIVFALTSAFQMVFTSRS